MPFALTKPLLAVGSQLKNTVALAWDKRVVLSPPIGDLDNLRSFQVFQQVIQDLQALYQVQAVQLACDAHPDYTATRWAKQTGLPLQSVWHHHAHASALYGEYHLNQTPEENWLVFTWDGVGLGADGTLWGGETFYGRPAAWQRVAHLRPLRLPGGEKAGREPWRSAAAVCWEIGVPLPETLHIAGDVDLLRQAWQKRLNCPQTTAAGRLFDAAASLCGVLHRTSFAGQAPTYLEALCDLHTLPPPVPVPWQCNAAGLWEAQWQDLFTVLLDKNLTALSYKATLFHVSLAQAIVALSQQLRDIYSFDAIGLCGGVFQNRVLSELSVNALKKAKFSVYLPEKLPNNDAAISFGQIIETAAQRCKTT